MSGTHRLGPRLADILGLPPVALSSCMVGWGVQGSACSILPRPRSDGIQIRWGGDAVSAIRSESPQLWWTIRHHHGDFGQIWLASAEVGRAMQYSGSAGVGGGNSVSGTQLIVEMLPSKRHVASK